MTFVKFNHVGRNQGFPFGGHAGYGDVFDKIFSDTNHWPDFGTMTGLPVNVSETEEHYFIEVQAAGYNKSDFQIELKEDKLTISVDEKGESKEDKAQEAGKNYIRKEFKKLSFSRAFNLPEAADQGTLRAEYKNGILEISISKKETEKLKKIARKIEIV